MLLEHGVTKSILTALRVSALFHLCGDIDRCFLLDSLLEATRCFLGKMSATQVKSLSNVVVTLEKYIAGLLAEMPSSWARIFVFRFGIAPNIGFALADQPAEALGLPLIAVALESSARRGRLRIGLLVDRWHAYVLSRPRVLRPMCLLRGGGDNLDRGASHYRAIYTSLRRSTTS
jgi:hypothetical protein